MKGTMSVNRSILATLIAGGSLAAICFAGLQGLPIVHAQTRLPAFTPRTISGTYAENLPGMVAMDEATANLVDFVQPGVVHIRSESKRKPDLMGNVMPAMGGTGSGVVYRPDGYIITNDHVVGGFDTVTVILQDGHELPGKVTRAQDIDLAIVKVDAKDLQTLPFGDSSKVRPGQFSMAVGSPFGFDNTVTFGHISAIGRTDQITDDRLNVTRDYPDLIQTDTPINMGNSGGPLVNIKGEVIGINTAIYSPTGMSNGIGFAIPSNTVRMIADKLITDGKVERGALGLLPETLKPYKAKEMGLDGGAIVSNVVNGTPAAMAGIKKDDVIVRVGNIPVKGESDVRDSMLSYGPGEKVQVEVVRDGSHKTYEVTLISHDKLPKPQVSTDKSQNPFGPNFQFPDIDELQKKMEEEQKAKGIDPNTGALREGDARLGVTVSDLSPTLRKQFHVPGNIQGALVTSVTEGSAADKIGLKTGDVIQELGGKPVDSSEALKDAMKDRKWGDQSTIQFSRYSEHTSMSQKIPFTF